ncbi:amidase [Bradyrhizobium sp. U87765 SZCCT0131]|uniref:amidase n=1 Tax=unclassified Bradyrhizobium TaxID=2631580 RepID=UPI001BAD6B25|nr:MULTISPECIES: amidase [unclassified Bradyrhizobium]MBR1218975.1 amidase [Bradyrhizobium sp. U87765 SZCCT0131]MBR1261626.1 amidase [Bradyrhizobium sp. U87765 SZCCT0134]MBR1306521.1 amidase [Bradyrhizobium sp. U87765 SZCCT0110]MBR1317408.1 amidase [Bradyrhizobium sp. U87765 SZCCT0109]MBR1351110.1 amidase [Bradyrhizobium sp. U87765 SZCCT0048]
MPTPSSSTITAPAAADDLARLSALELVAGYRAGRFSPVEVTQAVIDRVRRLDPKVNAFAVFDPETALEAARQSEQRWRRGTPLGALDGVPVTLKDLILAKGWPTLRGSRAVDPAQAWDEDAPAAARLREDGAVLLGKTTTSEFGWKGLGDSPLTGITRNPWNTAHTPGGSSGGAAAAAAFDFGPLHVATDGGGSTRLPAAHSGVFGFKPSFGRVPVYPPSQNGTLYHVTPLTRSVRDAAVLLNVIARPDARDWHALPPSATALDDGLEQGVKGLRIAFSPALGYAQVNPQVERLVADGARVFADLGATVELVDPGIDDPFPIFDTLWAAGAAKLLASFAPERRGLVEAGLQEVAARGQAIDVVAYLRAVDAREALGRHFNQFHQTWDLLITPTTAHPASAIDATQADLVRRPIRSPFTYPFNLTQQPAASVPVGLTPEGLPVGLQIVGARFADATVLRAARAFEIARPFARPGEPR